MGISLKGFGNPSGDPSTGATITGITAMPPAAAEVRIPSVSLTTSGMQMHLDAGDINSFAGGAAQTWGDLLGNYNFYRGSGGGVDAGDPTLSGTAGSGGTTAFNFDGNDFNTLIPTNDTFINSFHKPNAQFSLEFWLNVNIAPATAHVLFNTLTHGLAHPGLNFFFGEGGGAMQVWNESTSAPVLSVGFPRIDNGTGTAWKQFVVTWDEVAGNATIYINGSIVVGPTTLTYNGTLSPNNAVQQLHIGSNSAGSGNLAANSKIAIIRAYDRALLETEVINNYSVTKDRFGLL